jgi:hypothetical protein
MAITPEQINAVVEKYREALTEAGFTHAIALVQNDTHRSVDELEKFVRTFVFHPKNAHLLKSSHAPAPAPPPQPYSREWHDRNLSRAKNPGPGVGHPNRRGIIAGPRPGDQRKPS